MKTQISFLAVVLARNCFDKNYKGTVFSGIYTGRINTTIYGTTCQNWNADFPHLPVAQPIDRDHNFCRNPDNDARAGESGLETDTYCNTVCPTISSPR